MEPEPEGAADMEIMMAEVNLGRRGCDEKLFSVGESVEVRDGREEDWERGEVSSITGYEGPHEGRGKGQDPRGYGPGLLVRGWAMQKSSKELSWRKLEWDEVRKLDGSYTWSTPLCRGTLEKLGGRSKTDWQVRGFVLDSAALKWDKEVLFLPNIESARAAKDTDGADCQGKKFTHVFIVQCTAAHKNGKTYYIGCTSELERNLWLQAMAEIGVRTDVDDIFADLLARNAAAEEKVYNTDLVDSALTPDKLRELEEYAVASDMYITNTKTAHSLRTVDHGLQTTGRYVRNFLGTKLSGLYYAAAGGQVRTVLQLLAAGCDPVEEVHFNKDTNGAGGTHRDMSAFLHAVAGGHVASAAVIKRAQGLAFTAEDLELVKARILVQTQSRDELRDPNGGHDVGGEQGKILPNATRAIVSFCAGPQGRFWDVHPNLTEADYIPSLEEIPAIAYYQRTIGADMSQCVVWIPNIGSTSVNWFDHWCAHAN